MEDFDLEAFRNRNVPSPTTSKEFDIKDFSNSPPKEFDLGDFLIGELPSSPTPKENFDPNEFVNSFKIGASATLSELEKKIRQENQKEYKKRSREFLARLVGALDGVLRQHRTDIEEMENSDKITNTTSPEQRWSLENNFRIALAKIDPSSRLQQFIESCQDLTS
jgi:hypothetical protein